MDNNFEQLQKLIDSGESKNCIQFINNLSDQERSAVWPDLKKILPKAVYLYSPDGDYFEVNQRKAISISTLYLKGFKAYSDWSLEPHELFEHDELFPLLALFPNIRFGDYGEYLLQKSSFNWRLVYKLIRSDLTDKGERYYHVSFKEFSDKYSSMEDALLKDKEFLNNDLWILLQTEGEGEFSFAARDKYCKGDARWDTAIVSLVNSNHLPQEKVIESLLEALSKDFTSFRAQWYIKVVKDLSLTTEELVLYQERFLSFLGSSIPVIVSFAIKFVEKIYKTSPIKCSELVSALRPAMHSKQKGVVKSAVNLVQKALKNDTCCWDGIPELLSIAFLIDSADIHKKVLDIFEKYKEQMETSQLESIGTSYADAVVPSLKNNFLELFIPSNTTSRVTNEFVAQYHFPQNVVPIQSIEELLEQTSYCMEDFDDPIAFERVLDGFCRYGKEILDKHKKLFAPLINRQTDSCRYTLFLLKNLLDENRTSEAINNNNSIAYLHENSFYIGRINRVINQIIGNKSSLLMSLPTYETGAISVADFVTRLDLVNVEAIDFYDFSLALLRLEIEERSLLIPHIDRFAGDLRSALEYALEINNTPPVNKVLWLSSHIARINQPDLSLRNNIDTKELNCLRGELLYDWKINSRNDLYDSGDITTYKIELTVKNQEPTCDCEDRTLFHISPLFQQVKEREQIFYNHRWSLVWRPRWKAILIPRDYENYFAAAIPLISETTREVRDIPPLDCLRPLLFSSTELHEMGSLLTLMSLASGDSATRSLATDVLIALIDDGRINTKLLGKQMARLIPTGIIILGRWVKCLNEVISISNHHAQMVAELIQRSLRGDINDAPRDLGKYLDVLRQALAMCGEKVTDPEVIEYFSKNKRSGKVKKIIKELIGN